MVVYHYLLAKIQRVSAWPPWEARVGGSTWLYKGVRKRPWDPRVAINCSPNLRIHHESSRVRYDCARVNRPLPSPHPPPPPAVTFFNAKGNGRLKKKNKGQALLLTVVGVVGEQGRRRIARTRAQMATEFHPIVRQVAEL